MERRWKTELPESPKRFYFIATVCDPRQKGLLFPGVSADERATALEWFQAEFDSLWNKTAAAPAPAPAPTPTPAPAPAPAPPPSLGSFMDFMAGMAHLEA
eukprot:3451798-Prymnesium_polylepis.1